MEKINWKISRLVGTHPIENLAIEDTAFRLLKPNLARLLLWQNEPSVILGRFQNPWTECNLKFLKRKEIPLIRRLSGGGCVYHDLGNLNFTFMCPRPHYDKKAFLNLVIKALRDLGLSAQCGERFDLTVKGLKVTGSAFKENRDYCYHHGTLLVQSDLETLEETLKVQSENIQTKGTTSRRAKVTNLSSWAKINVDDVASALIKKAEELYDGIFTPLLFSSDEKKKSLETQKKISSESWIWMECPPFEQFFYLEGEKVGLTVKKGVIKKVTSSHPIALGWENGPYHEVRSTFFPSEHISF